MQLSLGQAAKLAGVGKTTISRAIAAGRLSANRREDGGYEIDPAELARVYDVRPERLDKLASGAPLDEIEDEDDAPQDAAEEARRKLEILVLEEQIKSLRALIQAEKDRREAAEADRDRWADQAARIAALLPPPAPPAPAPANEVAETRKAGLLDRLFGRRVA